MSVDPSSFDPNQIEFLANRIEDLIIMYGPGVLARYILDKVEARVGYKEECKLVNHLQNGEIDKAATLIDNHDDPQRVMRELEKICSELENCDVGQTELSDYRDISRNN